MEKIMEHFGIGLLGGVSGALFLFIFSTTLHEGGILKEFALYFMTAVCG